MKYQRRDNMAINVTTRKDNVKNIRSHALNATKKRQNLNLQVYRLEDGTKVRLSAKEIRTLMKNEKAA
jgi:ribosomal protein L28